MPCRSDIIYPELTWLLNCTNKATDRATKESISLCEKKEAGPVFHMIWMQQEDVCRAETFTRLKHVPILILNN